MLELEELKQQLINKNMAKKIYDVIPVRIVEKKKEQKEEEENIEVKEFARPQRERKKIGFKPWWFVVVILAVLLGVYFFVEGKAEVKIFPKTEEFSVNETTIVVDSMESMINYEKGIVPGIVFSDSKDYTEEYLATGTDDKAKKATGTIRVYNKITPAKPLSLIKGTRFLSSSGELIYRADSNFTIPAGKTEGGSFVNGSVEIKVTAAEAGEKYNLQSTVFSVPGLNGTEYYSNIWAEIVVPLTGGEESSVKIVTKNDITSSKNTFEDKYIDEARKALIANIPEGYIYFEDYINPKINNITVSAKENEEVGKFTVSGKSEVKATVFRNEDMSKLGETIIKKDLSELKNIVPNSIRFDVKEKKLNKDGKIEMTVVFNCNTYSMLEDDIIMGAILGKNKDNAANLLGAIPEIKKTEIKISPFFKTSVPKREERVNVQLDFSN